MSSPAKLFPIAMAMQGAQGLFQMGQGIFGGRKRRREEREAQSEYNRMKDKILTQDTSNPYKNLENPFEEMTVNTQQAEFQAQQEQQGQANIMHSMQGAAGGSGIAALAQAMSNQQSQNLQRSSATIGAQESQQQQAIATGEQRNQELMAKGDMMSRQMVAKQNATEFGWAGNRLQEAEAARAQAKQNLISGATSVLKTGLEAGNMFGTSTKPGGFGGGGTTGYGQGQQMHAGTFGPGGMTGHQMQQMQNFDKSKVPAGMEGFGYNTSQGGGGGYNPYGGNMGGYGGYGNPWNPYGGMNQFGRPPWMR